MQDTKLLVRDLMSTPVHTVGRNDKLSQADDLMKESGLRHLPVLETNGTVCGVVSHRDLFRGALLRALGYGAHLTQKLFDSMAIKEVMRSPVHTIAPDAPASEAAATLLEHRVGCLPVVEGDTLVGILSESDFVRGAAASA